ncbi:AAA family ATPase [Prochlorothrix hollandica]|uniref:AAA+ ATPase domain-containing protein n=1 Tax=Prochlorothrix hollandica PCC 9006 = CALU 1027 TaxID=317619 RepID=A0A0M2PYY9_PROHO|nr:AAA family ATPase [Prochlorothrix hollandica]KKI99606.1 hypothetical protein PROH_06780 [Prochlorothrix hollandica PCC 9006 = CALU 1027]
MLKTLSIENFRCFKRFELNPLGRINLLVGANNSGKSSILEAIYLLLNPNPLNGLYEVCIGRNEYSIEEDSRKLDQRPTRQLHIAHLLYNHDLSLGTSLKIATSLTDGTQPQLTLTVLNQDNLQESFDLDGFEPLSETLKLEINSLAYLAKPLDLRLSAQGMLSLEDLRRFPRQVTRDQVTRDQELHQQSKAIQVQLMRTLGLSIGETTDLFDKISLTPEEDLVTKTLQTIEPRLQRIASEGSTRRYPSDSFVRGGLKVRLEGQDQPIPIGSMGEGMWRMLGLALAIVNAKDGVLLVDEIDTGLHFTAMGEMWRMICQTAQDLNVQVFATTHSRDCWQSLAEVVQEGGLEAEQVFVHRIHPDREASVPFDGEELAIATEQDLEVR